MPVLTVYGISEKATQERLSSFILGLRQAVSSVKELKLIADQVSCFLPCDRFTAFRGEEIIIYVTSLLKKPERTPKVQDALARELVNITRTFFPDTALIECFVHTVSRSEIGFSSTSEE